MKTAIVTTTIHVPKLLADYAADAVKHKRAVEFIVVADRKTPPDAEGFCKKVEDDSGLRVRWMGVAQQEEYMAAFPELAKHIPWNCIQRRNVGHLLAYQEGFEVIAAIDDDNFLVDQDYSGLHMAALSAKETENVSAETGWFNCCELLEEVQGRRFFPRGYPVKQRGVVKNALKYSTSNTRVVVNAGLWLGDPDIDAVTRLAIPPDATKVKRDKTLALARGTWSPFNSQNTAVHRDIIPAWLMSPEVGRFDDIWGSYIALACIEKMGHAIAFGRPLVRQDRNVHDLWRDLDLERLGMRYTDSLCVALRDAQLSGTNYITCAEQAVRAVAYWASREPMLEKDTDARAAIEKFVAGYHVWIGTFRALETRQPAKQVAG